MKINKDLENALLICVHLSKHGRTTVEDIAEKFKLSPVFLQQIAHKLGKQGILTVFRGPHGGFELKPGIRVIDVLTAMNKSGFKTKIGISVPNFEYALVTRIFDSMWTELTPLLEVKIDTLVDREML